MAKLIIDFNVENHVKSCEVELSQEAIIACAKRFLAIRLASYYRNAENVEFGTMEVCDYMAKFKEL